MFDFDPNAPFMERLSGIMATLFAVKWCAKMAMLPMQSFAWSETKAHWSPEALAQRKINRKIYFDTKYPERPYIITPGDQQWQN
jgi:hypothetical protein